MRRQIIYAAIGIPFFHIYNTMNLIHKLSLSVFAATYSLGAMATPDSTYMPTPEIISAQQEFAANRFGIFIHWGIYSMFGQGEWYLNYGPQADEYAKAAAGFYPHNFDADTWVKAIKNAGARYICFTSRHHDGFSMWHTAQSDYNIVDATPFRRDVVKELAEACHRHGIKLHLYYSHIDWTRPDYPSGRTGLTTGRDSTLRDWPAYYKFMNAQLTELLTRYGPIGAIWFDGHWDHDADSIPFDWQLPEQYALIHKLQPSCLIGNNHHITPYPGENIQIFERDLPGENKAGLSGQDIAPLPLETCETMNGMWGYKVIDQNYKDADTLISLIVKGAGKGANLLLNIGPQPDGSLPAAALDRLHSIGEWMDIYGPTIYGTVGGDFKEQAWGTSTRSGNTVYIHVLRAGTRTVLIPVKYKIKKAVHFATGSPVKYRTTADGIMLDVPQDTGESDCVIQLLVKD